RRRRGVLLSALAVVLFSCWGIARIQVETDYIGFFHPRSSIRIDNALITSRLAGTQPIYVVIDGDTGQAVTRLDALRALNELQEFISHQPGVDTTISLLDYLRLVRQVLQPEATSALPETQSEVDQLLLLIDPADVRAVVNGDASRANLIVRTSLSRSVDVGAFVQRVQAFAAEHMPSGLRV